MFIFYLWLLILCMHVNSIIKFGRNFHRSDCYMSQDPPIRFIEIPHYFPTGPYLIHFSFIVKMITLKKEELPIEIVTNITFIRYDEPYLPCKNNFLLSTNGISFQEMILTINLSLIGPRSQIESFKYTFKNGFIPGRYLLLSSYNIFGMIVRLEYSDEEKSDNMELDVDTDWELLQIFSTVSKDVCFSTKNDGVVVLRPNYYDQKPDGMTIAVLISYEVKNEKDYLYRFPAFDCKADIENKNNSIIFFDQYPENTEISFFSQHMYVNKTGLQTSLAQFNLANYRREHISGWNNFKCAKKMFLVKEFSDTEQLSDGSNKTSYKSAFGEVYDTYINKDTKVMLNIVRKENIKLF